MLNNKVIKIIYKNPSDIQQIAYLITDILSKDIKISSKDMLILSNGNSIEFVQEDNPAIKGLLFKEEHISYYCIGGISKSYLKSVKSKFPDFVHCFSSGIHITYAVNTIIKDVVTLETTSYYIIDKDMTLSSINLTPLELKYPNIRILNIENLEDEINMLKSILLNKNFDTLKRNFFKKFISLTETASINPYLDELKLFPLFNIPRELLNFILKEELSIINNKIDSLISERISLEEKLS